MYNNETRLPYIGKSEEIISELEQIENITKDNTKSKEEISNAIRAKNVDVPEQVMLSEIPSYIEQIETGGNTPQPTEGGNKMKRSYKITKNSILDNINKVSYTPESPVSGSSSATDVICKLMKQQSTYLSSSWTLAAEGLYEGSTWHKWIYFRHVLNNKLLLCVNQGASFYNPTAYGYQRITATIYFCVTNKSNSELEQTAPQNLYSNADTGQLELYKTTNCQEWELGIKKYGSLSNGDGGELFIFMNGNTEENFQYRGLTSSNNGYVLTQRLNNQINTNELRHFIVAKANYDIPYYDYRSDKILSTLSNNVGMYNGQFFSSDIIQTANSSSAALSDRLAMFKGPGNTNTSLISGSYYVSNGLAGMHTLLDTSYGFIQESNEDYCIYNSKSNIIPSWSDYNIEQCAYLEKCDLISVPYTPIHLQHDNLDILSSSYCNLSKNYFLFESENKIYLCIYLGSIGVVNGGMDCKVYTPRNQYNVSISPSKYYYHFNTICIELSQ